MSTLSEKIKSLKDKDVNRIYSEEYRKAIWKLMIAFGGIYSGEEHKYTYTNDYVNYYGGKVELDLAATKKLLTENKWDLISWDELNDPAQHVGSGFCGTFTDSQLSVPFLKGELKFSDGTEYIWLTGVEDSSFKSLMRALQVDISLKEAVEHLKERTEKTSYGAVADQHNFSYSSVINI